LNCRFECYRSSIFYTSTATAENTTTSLTRNAIIIIIIIIIIQNDRTIPNNKPDAIRDNEKGTWMLIDVAIPGDRNVIQEET
jgi:hypothetical protein